MAMFWLVFGKCFIQSVVSINADSIKLCQLEKMVADLKVSHDILSQKIFEIQFKNNYWKEGIIEPHTEKENLKGTIDHLQDENRTQNKINSELEMEITEIKTLFKASESEELIKTKSSLLQILKEIKNRSTAKRWLRKRQNNRNQFFYTRN